MNKITAKHIFKISIKVIGLCTLVWVLAKLFMATGNLGFAGLGYAKWLYYVLMILFSTYLLLDNNYFFLAGMKNVHSIFITSSKQSIMFLVLKQIGMIVFTIQLNSILDFWQFYVSADILGIKDLIRAMLINFAVLLTGYFLLKSAPLKSTDSR